MFADASFQPASEQELFAQPVPQADAVQIGVEVPPTTPSPHAAGKPGRVASSSASEVSSRGEAGDVGDPAGTAEGSTSYKAIDQYKPLDHSMSLPPMGLVNIREALKRPTAEARGVFEPEPLPDIPEGMPGTRPSGPPEGACACGAAVLHRLIGQSPSMCGDFCVSSAYPASFLRS